VRKLSRTPAVVPGVTVPSDVQRPPTVRPSSRAYLMWGVSLFAYAVAVFHRSSLGVAAVEAQERFSAGASAVSLFLMSIASSKSVPQAA